MYPIKVETNFQFYQTLIYDIYKNDVFLVKIIQIKSYNKD